MAQVFEKVPAVHRRHEHVEQDQVGAVAGSQVLQGFPAVAQGDDAVTGLMKQEGQALAGEIVILDDKKRRNG